MVRIIEYLQIQDNHKLELLKVQTIVAVQGQDFMQMWALDFIKVQMHQMRGKGTKYHQECKVIDLVLITGVIGLACRIGVVLETRVEIGSLK